MDYSEHLILQNGQWPVKATLEESITNDLLFVNVEASYVSGTRLELHIHLLTFKILEGNQRPTELNTELIEHKKWSYYRA